MQAASAEAKNEDAASGSGDAGTHKISINSSEMPRTLSLAFYIKSGNVITEYVYDGTTIYDNTNGKDVTDIGLRDGKMTLQKITKDRDGKYSFIMPFYDIDIRCVFVAKETAEGSSNPASFIDYADGEDEEEEEAVEELSEEEVQQMLDVTPLVSRLVAETVMTATVSVAAMTH